MKRGGKGALQPSHIQVRLAAKLHAARREPLTVPIVEEFSSTTFCSCCGGNIIYWRQGVFTSPI